MFGDMVDTFLAIGTLSRQEGTRAGGRGGRRAPPHIHEVDQFRDRISLEGRIWDALEGNFDHGGT